MYIDRTAVKILADSLSIFGHRLTTFECTFPRFILAEVNTHRVFSRNSASSRARPVAKVIDEVDTDPFIPERFPLNKPGMSATQYILPGDARYSIARERWLQAKDAAVTTAQSFMVNDIHKQIANRVLEPYMWHTAIISATELKNFFRLRCDKATTQPEFYKLALMMQQTYNASTPTPVKFEGWHLPLTNENDHENVPLSEVIMLSAARCARVSYLTHDGVRDPAEDFRLYKQLASNTHLSPLEHQATPSMNQRHWANFEGWKQHRWEIEHGLTSA